MTFRLKLTILVALLAFSNIKAVDQPDKEKVKVDNIKLLLDLANKVYANQPDKSLQFAQTALILSKKNNDKLSEAQSLKAIGEAYYRFNFYRKSLSYFKPSLHIFDSISLTSSTTPILQSIGDIYYKLNSYDSALYYFNAALRSNQEYGNQDGIGGSLLRIGNIFWVTNNFDKALEYYFKALTIFEETNNPKGQAKVYLNIGIVYYITQFYNKALEYYNKSKEIIQDSNDLETLAALYMRFGEIYETKKEYQTALKNLDLSLVLYDSIKNDVNKCYVYRFKSKVLQKLGRTTDAINLLKEAQTISENYDNAWLKTEIFNDLAKYYTIQRNFNPAITNLTKAKELASQLKSWELLRENYFNYSDYFAAKGDYKSSLDYYRQFQAISDSIQNKEKNERIAQLQTKYESEKSKKELLLKEEEIQKSKEKLQRQKLQLYIFALGVISILILSFVLYRQYKLMEIKGRKIERINAELDERVKERTSALRLTQFSVEHASDPIFWISPRGKYLYANKAACKFLDYSKEEILKLNITDIIPKFSAQDWQEFWNIVKIEKSLTTESLHKARTGKLFPVEMVLNYIHHEGQEYTFAFVRDILERKQREESLRAAKEKAEEADKLKSAFLANMSHEIRTPMNAIIGFSDLLMSDDYDNDEKKEFGNLIKNSGSTLLKLIDDIIDISIIEAGHLKLKKSPQFVNTHLNEIALFFQEERTKQGKKDIDIILNVPESSDNIQIKTDPVRFRQIITNLVGNALKFTEKGFIEIGYEIDKKPVLKFFVKDSGIGIKKEKLGAIFERFHKLDDEKRLYAGTGLGLTISKRLVEELGGNLYVESEYEKGSSFFFTLPYTKVNISHHEDKFELDETKDNSVLLKDKHILIVEDVDSNYLFLRAILEKSTSNISWAKTGVQAIDFCKTTQPDIILMDIQLPELSGYEATKQIRKLYPSLPIVAQTAYAFSGEKEKIIAAGCNDYITKPIKPQVLFEVLKKYLN